MRTSPAGVSAYAFVFKSLPYHWSKEELVLSRLLYNSPSVIRIFLQSFGADIAPKFMTVLEY